MEKLKNLYYNMRRHISNLRYHFRKMLNMPRETEFDYVDLVFENCDFVRIPPLMVRSLSIEDIHKDIWTTFSQQYIETVYCKKFTISFDAEALKTLTHFQHVLDSSVDSFEYHLNVYKDITLVEIKPKKKDKICVAVPYKNESENSDVNLLQKTDFLGDTVTITCAKE